MIVFGPLWFVLPIMFIYTILNTKSYIPNDLLSLKRINLLSESEISVLEETDRKAQNITMMTVIYGIIVIVLLPFILFPFAIFFQRDNSGAYAQAIRNTPFLENKVQKLLNQKEEVSYYIKRHKIELTKLGSKPKLIPKPKYNPETIEALEKIKKIKLKIDKFSWCKDGDFCSNDSIKRENKLYQEIRRARKKLNKELKKERRKEKIVFFCNQTPHEKLKNDINKEKNKLKKITQSIIQEQKRLNSYKEVCNKGSVYSKLSVLFIVPVLGFISFFLCKKINKLNNRLDKMKSKINNILRN